MVTARRKHLAQWVTCPITDGPMTVFMPDIIVSTLALFLFINNLLCLSYPEEMMRTNYGIQNTVKHSNFIYWSQFFQLSPCQ